MGRELPGSRRTPALHLRTDFLAVRAVPAPALGYHYGSYLNDSALTARGHGFDLRDFALTTSGPGQEKQADA